MIQGLIRACWQPWPRSVEVIKGVDGNDITLSLNRPELANGTRILGDPKSSPAGAPCRSPLQSFRRSLTTSSSSPNRGPTAFSSSA